MKKLLIIAILVIISNWANSAGITTQQIGAARTCFQIISQDSDSGFSFINSVNQIAQNGWQYTINIGTYTIVETISPSDQNGLIAVYQNYKTTISADLSACP